MNQTHHNHIHERPHRHHYDAEMLSVEDARERILSYFKPLATTEVPLLDGLGLTLAEDLDGRFRRSAFGQFRYGRIRSDGLQM